MRVAPQAHLADTIPARFTGGRTAAVPRYLAEPTAITSTPGTVDVVYVGSDDRLRHLRYLDGTLPIDVAVDARVGIVAAARPAAVAPLAKHMSAQPAKSIQADPTPAPGERRSPLAFIIDEEGSIRQFVSLILQGSGVDTIEFTDGASFREMPIARSPDLVFLNVNLEVQDAVQSIEALSKSGFAGTVQLMSSRGSAVLDTVKQAGEQMKLQHAPGAQEAVRDLGGPEDHLRAQARSWAGAERDQDRTGRSAQEQLGRVLVPAEDRSSPQAARRRRSLRARLPPRARRADARKASCREPTTPAC